MHRGGLLSPDPIGRVAHHQHASLQFKSPPCFNRIFTQHTGTSAVCDTSSGATPARASSSSDRCPTQPCILAGYRPQTHSPAAGNLRLPAWTSCVRPLSSAPSGEGSCVTPSCARTGTRTSARPSPLGCRPMQPAPTPTSRCDTVTSSPRVQHRLAQLHRGVGPADLNVGGMPCLA